ncbi:hypothetical protein [Sanguibacter sp. 25GB23B1]|uniref:hypothetical protein n=1 Tax=unclassified Sanguibacter TaxID=2645534 RepID=UPI0032AF767A
MSTVPGDDALRDAGIISHDLDEAVNLVDEIERPLVPAHVETAAVPEDYDPGTARPDLAGGADEADVLDQAWVVPVDEEDVDPA